MGGSIASIIGLLTFFGDQIFDHSDIRMEVSVDTQVPSALDSRLDIRFDGKPVENVANIVFKIENNGTKEFDKSDFDGPIEYQIKGVREILFAERVGSYPVGVELDVMQASNNIVQVRPGLLNPGDFGEIKVIASCDRVPKITVSLNRARIKGIQHPKIAPFRESPVQLLRRRLPGAVRNALWGLFVLAVLATGCVLGRASNRFSGMRDS